MRAAQLFIAVLGASRFADADMASHYDTAIVPARPRKPKDKAKVEVGVQIVERWIVARLRNRQFFSLDQANAAIRPLLDELNSKVTRHLGIC